MARRPGKVVRCQDGAIGRTYNGEELIQGKVKVYVFAASMEDLSDPKKTVGECIKNRLCDPKTLTVVGMANYPLKKLIMFQTLKTEILKRAKAADACTGEYNKALNAENITDLLQVVKDNFHFCYSHRVVDVAMIKEYESLFNSEKIYANVSISEGFLLAYGNATVEAYGNATVEASDNATVEAYGNATVRAYDNATVRAYDNATVRAYGNATVEASDNATVRAYGNATVRAYDNATVRAYDNATVEAYDNAYITSYSVIEVTLNDKSIYRVRESNTIYYKSDLIKFDKR